MYLEKLIKHDKFKTCLKKSRSRTSPNLLYNYSTSYVIGWKYFYRITSLDHFTVKWYHKLSFYWYDFSSRLYHTDINPNCVIKIVFIQSLYEVKKQSLKKLRHFSFTKMQCIKVAPCCILCMWCNDMQTLSHGSSLASILYSSSSVHINFENIWSSHKGRRERSYHISWGINVYSLLSVVHHRHYSTLVNLNYSYCILDYTNFTHFIGKL